MKKSVFFIALSISFICQAQNDHTYSIDKVFHMASPGGWDYLAVQAGKLYVSHGTQVNILDKKTGDSLGVILNTTGVHGIAFDASVNKGYTSNGRLNNITVFDLSSYKVSGQIPTGENPDAIMFESFSKKIITCNGRSKDLSIIDPLKETVIATIPVGGKPETAVSDGEGFLFVNIEDKNEVVRIDLRDFSVKDHWSLGKAEGPTGLAMDKKSKRLFIGCDQKLVVMNAANGSVVDMLPIGDGCDGVAFDSNKKLIFTANGEGTLTVIQENTAEQFSVIGNYNTKKGARTITFDEETGNIYLPTAEFDPVNKNANGRPLMIPGSFQVLVIR